MPSAQYRRRGKPVFSHLPFLLLAQTFVNLSLAHPLLETARPPSVHLQTKALRFRLGADCVLRSGCLLGGLEVVWVCIPLSGALLCGAEKLWQQARGPILPQVCLLHKMWVLFLHPAPCAGRHVCPGH